MCLSVKEIKTLLGVKSGGRYEVSAETYIELWNDIAIIAGIEPVTQISECHGDIHFKRIPIYLYGLDRNSDAY